MGWFRLRRVKTQLPSRQKVIEALNKMQELDFAGFFLNLICLLTMAQSLPSLLLLQRTADSSVSQFLWSRSSLNCTAIHGRYTSRCWLVSSNTGRACTSYGVRDAVNATMCFAGDIAHHSLQIAINFARPRHDWPKQNSSFKN